MYLNIYTLSIYTSLYMIITFRFHHPMEFAPSSDRFPFSATNLVPPYYIMM